MSAQFRIPASGAEPVQRASESLRFAGGEWLLDESWQAPPQPGRPRPLPVHRLYFQRGGSAARESLGDIAMGEVGAASLHAARPLLFRGGGRCALVLGRYVFQRWERPQGPWWYRVTTQPFGAAAFFLRAYLRDGECRNAAADAEPVPASYVFGHLDLERNVLVTSREHADSRHPQFLVYSAPEYGEAWRFDAERTRRVNGMQRLALGDE